MIRLQVVEHVPRVSVFRLHSLATDFADGKAVENDRTLCVLQEPKVFPDGKGALRGWMKLRKLRSIFHPRVSESFLREDQQSSNHSESSEGHTVTSRVEHQTEGEDIRAGSVNKACTCTSASTPS